MSNGVRLAHPDDLTALMEIAAGFIGEANVPGTYDAQVTKTQLTFLLEQIWDQDDPDFDMKVYEENGKIGGVYIAHAAQEFMKEKWIYLGIFYVCKPFRSKHVAHSLVKSLIDFQKRKKGVALFVSSGAMISEANDRRFATLFKSHGFEMLGPLLMRRL